MSATPLTTTLLTTEIRYEPDVVLARQRARQIAALLGFDPQDQNRIATAVSEIARNAFQYAGGGTAGFQIVAGTPPRLAVRIVDTGAGIGNLEQVLAGRYMSPTGLGLGIVGARRLMDHCDIDSLPGQGTIVVLSKNLPEGAFPSPSRLAQIAGELAAVAPQNPFQEIQSQNQELLRALDALRVRQIEAERLNRELEETNRGVMALIAELDDKAGALQRASESKSRFLFNIGHEIRTPLNAILSLSRILLDRLDGDLTPEQEKQVQFIHSSGESLAELVSDLLDLARIEAGKTVVRPRHFTVEHLFGTLRGMFRPVPVASDVALVFEDASDLPPLWTDEGKVAQILRNFISNALKFTTRGEVRVRISREPNDCLCFAVSDTGIGIAPEDQERVFEEFTQVENSLQSRARGAGLGLPLTRGLCELLGGRAWVESRLGQGSTFYALLPRVYAGDDAPIGAYEPPETEGVQTESHWIGAETSALHSSEASGGLTTEMPNVTTTAMPIEGTPQVKIEKEAGNV